MLGLDVCLGSVAAGFRIAPANTVTESRAIKELGDSTFTTPWHRSKGKVSEVDRNLDYLQGPEQTLYTRTAKKDYLLASRTHHLPWCSNGLEQPPACTALHPA